MLIFSVILFLMPPLFLPSNRPRPCHFTGEILVSLFLTHKLPFKVQHIFAAIIPVVQLSMPPLPGELQNVPPLRSPKAVDWQQNQPPFLAYETGREAKQKGKCGGEVGSTPPGKAFRMPQVSGCLGLALVVLLSHYTSQDAFILCFSILS